jgi:hypothetical protein
VPRLVCCSAVLEGIPRSGHPFTAYYGQSVSTT